MGRHCRRCSINCCTGTAGLIKEKKGRRRKMNILVINCGSSSLKFQLIDAQSEKLIAKGLCERIGIDGS